MNSDEMDKFGFLIGNWNLEYRIPESKFSQAKSDSGTGSFSRVLSEKYVIFEYSTVSGSEAKGIFAWDERIKAYRYWWFENSGNFLTATCNFITNETLAMNWHDTLMVQTFAKEGSDKVVLRMQYPGEKGGYDPLMEVVLIRK